MRISKGSAEVSVRPEVAMPGQTVHISASVQREWIGVQTGVARLRNTEGELLTEISLTPIGRSLKGSLPLPSTAKEGVYNLVISFILNPALHIFPRFFPRL